MMRYSAGWSVSCAVLTALCALEAGAYAQVIGGGQYPPGQTYPGQTYPGGQYPQSGGIGGISLPGTRRRTNNDPNNPNSNGNSTAQNYVGMLRRTSRTDFALETDDRRVITVLVGSNTRYYDDQGKSAQLADFFPGDHVSVDATSDNQAYLHAVRVRLERAGSAADRAAAEQPVTESPTAPRGGSSPSSSSGDGDSDRPVLRRKADTSDSAQSSSSRAADDDPDRPILRRKPDAADTNSTASSSAPAPRPAVKSSSDDDEYVAPVSRRPAASASSGSGPIRSSDDDPDRPVLRRGKPADNSRTANSSNNTSSDDDRPVIASNRPPVRPQVLIDGDEPVTPRRASAYDIAPANVDPVIEKAREAAFDFIETLPNYIVKQYTTRSQSDNVRGRVSFQAQDVVTADVVCEGGKESYKNILVNGRPPRGNIEDTGSWSSGEFASVLQDILSPSTNARFYNKRSSTIVNRSSYRFDFSVEQENSHWFIHASSQSYQPAYTGAIWIDKETSRVLRIEMTAKNMPSSFPLDQVESATDYDFVMISDGKFLLPVHSEALSCTRGTSLCSKNSIDFRNYRKFGADTAITFDTDDAPKKKP